MRLFLTLLLAAFATAPARAQDGQDTVRIELRVSATRAGATVVIDRGAGAGLALGDRVRFLPVRGGTFEGIVVELEDRFAVVELSNPNVRIETGVRGEVLIPLERLERDVEVPVAVPEHSPWEHSDENWSPGMPLLALGAVRPETRPVKMNGRVYFIGNGTYTTDQGRSDAFLRAGTEIFVENPMGQGGGVHFDGEFNYRVADVPDDDDEDRTDLRIDRISYYRGGNRFSDERWEAGRFLQYGMPEFGVLDGFEYDRRRLNGDRWGVSVGSAPDPDDKLESAGDFQMAGYYRWVLDELEQLSFDGGYQRTGGDAGRDLFVAKARYLPPKGWNFHGTAWIDAYGSGDDEKGSGLEVTQAIATTGHLWESGNGLSITYSRVRFPETGNELYDPLIQEDIYDSRVDRLGLTGWRWVEKKKRLHGRIGVWDDDDGSGADIELGMDVQDLWIDRGRGDLSFFAGDGQFSDYAGARLSFGRNVATGYWDVMYEVATHSQTGFDDENDDMVMHRIRTSREFHDISGWNLSVFGESNIWAGDSSYSLGLFLQKSF